MFALLAQSGGGDESAQTIAILLGVGALVLYLLLIAKFFQIAADVRSIRSLLEDQQDAREDEEPGDIDQLRRLGELRRDGLLTDEEFAMLKEGLFASGELPPMP